MDQAVHSLTTFSSDLLGRILGLLPGYAASLREVCQQWRALVANLRLGSMSLSDLSYQGHADLLVWAHVKAHPPKALERIMVGAAEGGHEACMNLAKSWGATDYDWAMIHAAEGGYEACMNLAKDWGATDYDEAMICAAGGDHTACMTLAKSWGATNYDGAMRYAAAGGRVVCMELAKSWGATNNDRAMAGAAGGGHAACVKLLKSWGATD